ncbi:unnamed protein product [Spirodela intermedia]|uniref:DUF7792 domain-containing protein n=1 Tax=Spirodela intermedia TaxID=51605 RepID=A0A7I8K3A1_SPIIN|nr:unnamed protein product [Spirodela intermedia]
MAEGVRQVLQRPIQLADEVIKLADDAHPSFKADYVDLRVKADRLAALLRQAARADLYERPTRRIMHETEQVLEKAHSIASKSRTSHGLIKRVFNPATPSRKIHSQLDNCITDVSWLLRVSATRRHDGGEGGDSDDDDDVGLGLPPIAANEPILGLIWEAVAKLQNGSLEKRTSAASELVSLASDNDRNWKLIIEEGGVGPLLKLVKEGKAEGQENAVKAILLLARDSESVEKLVQAGVCSIFAKVLKEGPMKVQASVANAVAELVDKYLPCQDEFAQHNVVRLLVAHLAFETLEEHSKYTIPSKSHMSIHSVVLASNKNQMHNTTQSHHGGDAAAVHPAGNGHLSHQQHPQGSSSGASLKGRESEDPETKAAMKAMAAKALALLARGHPNICKNITDSRALLCFASLLEKGPDDVRYNSAIALKEIARVAEDDADLRRSAFNPSSPAAKAVVDQLLRVIEEGDSDRLLLPCITAIGCLSRTFRAKETRIIGPLVRFLEREGQLTREAVIALTKFACTENYLHMDHSRAIINAQAAKPLVQLVYLGEPPSIRKEALVLLCYIVRHVPESEALTDNDDVISALRWASKNIFTEEEEEVEKLLTEAKGRLELYQSRDPRGFR